MMNISHASAPVCRHRSIVGGALVATALLLPGGAFAGASYTAFGFASLSLTPVDGLSSFGAVDLDESFTDIDPPAEANILSDFVFVMDDFTLQDVGVSGSAGPSLSGFTSSFAFVDTSTSLTLFNETSDPLSVEWILDYSLDVAATVDDPTFDAAGATSSLLLGGIDFSTGESTDIFKEVLELVTTGDLSVLSDTGGTIEIPASGFFGLFVDLSVDGLALSTELSNPAVPVPGTLALFGVGMLGLTVYRRARSRRSE